MFHPHKPAFAPRKTPKPKLPFGVRLATVAALALGWWIAHTSGASYSASVIAGVIAGLAVLGAYELARARSRASAAGQRTPGTPATVPELHEQARVAGGGAYLAHSAQGRWISAPAEVAGLVLAGPRAGKTSCVGIPALIAHPGAAVSTSTKPEVFTATLHVRQVLGRVWFFDFTGAAQPPAGVQRLRWSPLQRARDWPGAQTVAEAMTGAAEIEHDAAHWTERASALLAACFHAAALAGLEISDVSSWILRHDPEAPLAELDSGSIAHDVLYGIKQTADRERSGIFSTAARVLRAYRSPAALKASSEPNFDPLAFVGSSDTIYIAAAAHEQQLLAPLVVGLLTDIRHAVYGASWQGGRAPWPPVLFLLDECANVAPIPDLPAMLSEAGGQGLQVICVFQDISQVRRRWPREADGFMSLFGAKIILSGVADPKTLEQLSLLCGDWDRPVQTLSEQKPVSWLGNPNQRTKTESWTTRRERRVPPDRIAQLARGEALVMIGPGWELVPTLPYHQHPTFAPIAQAARLSAIVPAAIAEDLLEADR
jgi:type IV secretion system protein VirD4